MRGVIDSATRVEPAKKRADPLRKFLASPQGIPYQNSMSDETKDQTPDPDLPEAGDSTPAPKAGGTPAPDLSTPEPEDDHPAPVQKEESQEEVSAAQEFDASLGEAPAPGQGEMSESDDRTFGMLVHLLGAFTYIVGPIVIWMIKKEESPFVDDQGKEAVNWQISVALVLVGLMMAANIPFVGCVAVPAMFGVGVANLIFCILACVDANKGKGYRYPYNLRLIK
jgi:uncharacterized Tic20 family protein